MADDLDFIERATPRRDAARSSRRALAEYYNTKMEATTGKGAAITEPLDYGNYLTVFLPVRSRQCC